MIKEATGTADTIEEAKENAIALLNADADADIQFDVLEMPKPKVLGLFGGSKAVVRAFIELPDPVKPKERKKAEEKTSRPVKPAGKKESKAPVKNNEPAKEARPAKSASQDKTVRKDEPVYSEPVAAADLEANSPAAKAVAYVQTVLKGLGCENIEIQVALRDGGAKIMLLGEGLGVVIGHRGETLDALQYLSSLAAGSSNGYFKVALDIGNYREKRERTLVSLANRISNQVLRTGRSRSLEPMNPYERRIIHTAVQEIGGVVSNSVGEGASRRVVISPEGGSNRPSRKAGLCDRNQDKHCSDRSTSAKTQTVDANREPVIDSSDFPLYGKIR